METMKRDVVIIPKDWEQGVSSLGLVAMTGADGESKQGFLRD